MKKRIYSVIEVKNRELYARILFSIKMAEAGYSIVLGKKSNLYKYANYFKKGLFVFKGMGPKNINIMKKLKFLGHKIVGYDEEGLVMNLVDEIPRRIKKECLDFVEYYFTVGKKQKDNTVKIYPEFEKKIIPVGNPRFDLLKKPINNIYSIEIEKIKKKYGKFILFPTSFTITNNHLYDVPPILREIVKREFNYQKKTLMELKNFLNYFPQKYPNIKIIIKPHPVEKIELWEKLIKDLNVNNVIIADNKFTTNSYLLASEINISTNSHTSLESFMANKISINWRIVKDEVLDSDLIVAISKNIDTTKELEDIIIDWFKNKKFIKELNKLELDILNYNIENIKFNTSHNLLEKIKMIDLENNSKDKYSSRYLFFLFKIIKKVKVLFYHLKTTKKEIQFFRSKFDSLDFYEYNQKIKLFCNLLKINYDKFSVKELFPGCFKLELKD